ncbi:MAG TPA: DUF4097 family beta strand repeat-containing protein [Steroidobacteraceae bacterium]|nr:DUF4097 family beta strand repeat-containing protein [Steroidobacteraceae bacterium]
MRTVTTLTVLALALAAGTPARAGDSKTFDREVTAEPHGVVEISNTAGEVQVSGWDRSDVSIHANLDEDVDRVEVTSSPGRTVIKVILPAHSWHGSEAHLRVQVPKDSELRVSTVSADTSVTGVTGIQRLNAVSGNVTTEIAGADLELKTVSGDVKVKGRGLPAQLRITSVSGDVHLQNGGGSLEANTVSGTLVASLEGAKSVVARTTSGDMHLDAKLTRGASFEATTVSGDLEVRASADGGYAYEVSTFSGDITDCFGGQQAQKGYVGHSLSGSRGDGAGRMRLKTMSGDVQLCDRT